MEWYIFAIIGAFFTGFASITHKRTVKDVEAIDFSAVLAIVNMIIVLPILVRIDFSLIDARVIFLIMIGSVFATAGFLFMSKAVKHLEISSASSFFAFAPAIVALFAFIFLGESLGIIQLVGIFMIMVGAYLLELEHKDWKEPFKVIRRSKYIHYLFLSMIIYGFGALIDRTILSRSIDYGVNALTYIAIIHVFIALNFLFLVFLFSKGIYSIRTTMQTVGLWIILMSAFTFIYRFFQAKAIEIAPNVAFVSVIKRMSIFIPIIIGGKLFSEKNLKKKAISASIMIFGSILIILF